MIRNKIPILEEQKRLLRIGSVRRSLLFVSIVFILQWLPGLLFSQESASDNPVRHYLYRDTLTIYFFQGKADYSAFYRSNERRLNQFIKDVEHKISVENYKVTAATIFGAASLEGGLQLNKELAMKRANRLLKLLHQRQFMLDGFSVKTNFLGRNWNELLRILETDKLLPNKQNIISFIKSLPTDANGIIKEDTDYLQGFTQVAGAEAYAYLNKYLFPELRSSVLEIALEKFEKEEVPVEPQPRLRDTVPATIIEEIIEDVLPCKPLFLDLRTNLLHDLLLTPNIGAEMYLGRGYSLLGNWSYAWWNSNHNYWRISGGDIEVRRYLGHRSHKPLTGHHLGLYGQMATFDFGYKGKGFIGDRWFYGGGVAYGYSLPITKQFNLDFTLGLGYLKGQIRKYEWTDRIECYKWLSTQQRSWFGPTKLEVSLVWLIGCDNINIFK